jgi:PAS domain S-box-containing protein
MVYDNEPHDRAAPLPCADAFSALAEAVDRCVFVKDTSGRYTRVNAAFCRWLGRPEAEILGRTVFDVWPPSVAESLDAADSRALAGELVEREECRPNGREMRTLRTVTTTLRDEAGRVTGVLGCFADVTDERRREEDYRQSLRLAAVGRLAAGLTHDLNHLLTLIQGNAALLTAGVPADAPEYLLADRVQGAALRAAELMKRLVAFARPDAPAETAVLNETVAEVTNLFRAVLDRRIVLDVRPGEGLPPVRVPPVQLTQVVLNLCLNARDAMPEGGRLSLQTDLLRPADPRRVPSFVRLRVTDTGTGMSPEVRARVFDPWYTTKANGKGTGLGLAIIQDVVRRHGGRVECDTAVGRGTSFTVLLPADDPEPDPALLRASAFLLPPPTVLLADNDSVIVLLCRTILETNGYRVHVAEDGREATATFRREQGRIGVVLLDQNMPGMSGVEVLSELAAVDPGVRAIFMSGAPLGSVPSALTRNLRGFLCKPFRTEQLLDVIRGAMAGA